MCFDDPECSQVLMETPVTANPSEFCPMLNNEQFKLLALTLDTQAHKTTIKIKIAAHRKTYELL